MRAVGGGEMTRVKRMRVLRSALVAMAGLLGGGALSGCLVAGYSSRGGAFVWPGGLGLVLMLVLIYFLLRGRR